MKADSLTNTDATTILDETGPSSVEKLVNKIGSKSFNKTSSSGANCANTGSSHGACRRTFARKGTLPSNPFSVDKVATKVTGMVQKKQSHVVQPKLNSFPIWSSLLVLPTLLQMTSTPIDPPKTTM